MTRNRELRAKSQAFGDQVALIIRQTVASTAHLNAYPNDRDEVYIGTAGPKIAKTKPIKLETGRPFAHLWLNVGFNLRLDVDDHLTVFKSVFGVNSGADADKELFRFDYDRTKSNYPDSHLQIFGYNQALNDLFTALGLPKARTEHLHFPMGGRRYRPTVEDVLEFLILQGLVQKSEPDLEAARALLDASRSTFHRIQLAAAIRRDVPTALEALDKLGYDVVPRKSTERGLASVAKLLPFQRGSKDKPDKPKKPKR